jgi:hypothetical protein
MIFIEMFCIQIIINLIGVAVIICTYPVDIYFDRECRGHSDIFAVLRICIWPHVGCIRSETNGLHHGHVANNINLFFRGQIKRYSLSKIVPFLSGDGSVFGWNQVLFCGLLHCPPIP